MGSHQLNRIREVLIRLKGQDFWVRYEALSGEFSAWAVLISLWRELPADFFDLLAFDKCAEFLLGGWWQTAYGDLHVSLVNSMAETGTIENWQLFFDQMSKQPKYLRREPLAVLEVLLSKHVLLSQLLRCYRAGLNLPEGSFVPFIFPEEEKAPASQT